MCVLSCVVSSWCWCSSSSLAELCCKRCFSAVAAEQFREARRFQHLMMKKAMDEEERVAGCRKELDDIGQAQYTAVCSWSCGNWRLRKMEGLGRWGRDDEDLEGIERVCVES